MVGCILSCLLALSVNLWLVTPLSPQLVGKSVRRVATQEKVVALTYDDGPDVACTPELLKVLDDSGVKATFFVVGQRVEQYPQIIEQAWRAGHQIGNHSWSHQALVFKNKAHIRSELQKTDAAIRATGYDKEILVRAPYGLKYWTLPKELSRTGRTHILFDVVAWDWQEPGREAITKRVLSQVRPGSIILLHDGCGNKDDLVGATGDIIDALKEQGYRFVTVSELLAMKKERKEGWGRFKRRKKTPVVIA